MSSLRIFLLSGILLLTSCINNVARWGSGTCEVHGLKMKKVIVGNYGARGCPPPDPSYPHPKKNNCSGCTDLRKRAKIWVCDECTRVYYATEGPK